jgi:hypothetical protein
MGICFYDSLQMAVSISIIITATIITDTAVIIIIIATMQDNGDVKSIKHITVCFMDSSFSYTPTNNIV